MMTDPTAPFPHVRWEAMPTVEELLRDNTYYTLPAEFIPSKMYVMRTVDTGMMAQVKAERAAQIERNTKGLIDIMVRFHEEDQQEKRAAIRADVADREIKP